MKRFRRGLVVGKFAPLHRGHELVIEQARRECDEVIVLSYTKPEFPRCDPERRERWLRALFPGVSCCVLDDARLRALGPELGLVLPRNDAPDVEHRELVARVCHDVLGVTVDAVFTSEDYGDGFAAHLTAYFQKRYPQASVVTHVLVDRARVRIPISATTIRKDLEQHAQWLSPVVRASFVRRVAIVGGESSGKSTLAQALAMRLGTVHVEEYGRELWEGRNGQLAFEDMLHIAEVQIEREEEAALHAHQYVICDTTPLTTRFYSEEMFACVDTLLQELAQRRYDLLVLAAPDFPFVQDGTRRDATFRDRQHAFYVDQLTRGADPWLLVEGSVEQRIEMVLARLNALGGRPHNVSPHIDSV